MVWDEGALDEQFVVLRRSTVAGETLCKLCLERGTVTPASVADHVEPHGGNVNKFYSGVLMELMQAVPLQPKALHGGQRLRARH